ncbi:SDR family oxidoreductase [Chitinophaga polysaccharea]|uniref:SDR family oxidoreductase n=1 Tax=Chitinophaga polysaccharea TaxID=1293035 RepID=UPI001455A1C2|nr:SDR family oxidoreductase [Chitinophaga polysaccharea]NLR61856.1 SDR family oxidoreductase [Chitinophaga polysaccharea]
MDSLKNKIIAVTGGNGQLGGHFVSYLRSEGATVISIDKAVENNLGAGTLSVDTTDLEAIKGALDAILNKYQRIDGWVNSAYPRTDDWGKKTFADESMDSFEQNMTWHLGGYVKCSQVILNQMMKQKGGSLINLSSIYGIVGPDFTIYEGTAMMNPGGYAAIKGGIINMTRYLAAYYGPYNVRVNCVSPGGIFNHQAERFVRQYEQKVPIRRLGTPEDISPSISFLLSDGAKYITGHNLVVDGGWTAI